jgi:ATP-dependent DNA helicase RecG
VDLRLRGPGDVLGTAQSGIADLKFADFLADPTLLREARALADEVIARDPHLDQQHTALRPWISEELALREQRD